MDWLNKPVPLLVFIGMMLIAVGLLAGIIAILEGKQDDSHRGPRWVRFVYVLALSFGVVLILATYANDGNAWGKFSLAASVAIVFWLIKVGAIRR